MVRSGSRKGVREEIVRRTYSAAPSDFKAKWEKSIEESMPVVADKATFFKSIGDYEKVSSLQDKHSTWLSLYYMVKKSKIISFPGPLIESILGKVGNDSVNLDYRLPFKNVIIFFSPHVTRELGCASVTESDSYGFIVEKKEAGTLVALLLSQFEFTKDDIEALVINHREAGYDFDPSHYEKRFAQVGKVINQCTAHFSNDRIQMMEWESGGFCELIGSLDSSLEEDLMYMRKVAIGCIGYINCENVEIREEAPPPALAKARERRRGKVPEPYYVCYIEDRKAGYGMGGVGTKHGYIYDVRGHFRRLDETRVTWVRPHQRGLANDMYIPKTYKVKDPP